jgi:acyl-CoA reductase-like NAD-dependent aldehyde dehydrogenase
MAGKERRSQLLIGGKWVEASGDPYEVINPATEEVVGTAPQATVADAEAAAAAARDALPGWSATPTRGAPGPHGQSGRGHPGQGGRPPPPGHRRDGGHRRRRVPHAGPGGRRPLRPVLPGPPPGGFQRSLPPQVAQTTPLAPGGLISGWPTGPPVGVVTCITSYNFPMVNMAGKVAPALAMGNTVVVKPAPQDPLAVIELVRILDEVGFPPGVVNLVTANDAAAAAALVASPDVDMVSFTGSTDVGSASPRSGATTMKRLLLELGRQGRLSRLRRRRRGRGRRLHRLDLVLPLRPDLHRPHPGRRPARLSSIRSSRAASLRLRLQVGDPTDPKTIVGPVISAAHRDRIEGYIATGRSEGAELITGGDRPADLERGFYVVPTLFTGTNDMVVAREEIFGPVVVVIPFDDEEEGISIANDSDFGLYDYVFSGDTARAFRVAKQLRAGHVGINSAQRNHEAPFGGFKMSGSAATAATTASRPTRRCKPSSGPAEL